MTTASRCEELLNHRHSFEMFGVECHFRLLCVAAKLQPRQETTTLAWPAVRPHTSYISKLSQQQIGASKVLAIAQFWHQWNLDANAPSCTASLGSGIS